MACTTEGTVPGKWLIDIITYKIKHVHSHTYGAHDPAVTAKIFQIPNQDQFEKYYRINALLTLSAIILSGFCIQPLKVEQIFQAAIEVIFGNTLR